MGAPTTTSQPAGGGYSLGTPGAGDHLGKVTRHFDVVIVVLGAIPALLLGAPALGYLIGAGAWVGQTLLAHVDRRWLAGKQFGAGLFEAFGRIWLLAGAIVIAGVAGGRPDGLTAAVTIFVAYSIAFGLRVLNGRPEAPVQR